MHQNIAAAHASGRRFFLYIYKTSWYFAQQRSSSHTVLSRLKSGKTIQHSEAGQTRTTTMIFNLRRGMVPATFLRATARQLQEELEATEARLAEIKRAQALFYSPLEGPADLEVVIPEQDPKDVRGWASGSDIGVAYKQAVACAGGQKNSPFAFLNLGSGDCSIAISPLDFEDESKITWRQQTERMNFIPSVVWSKTDRGPIWLLEPAAFASASSKPA